MSSAESFKPLSQVIENENHLAAWLQRCRLEAALTRAVRAHLPRLIAGQVRVTDMRDEQLELTVPSGALATAVRQRVPALLVALASHALEFNGIRVRVQPLAPPGTPTIPPRRSPPAPAPLETLVKQLQDGPLKDAVSRLISRR